MNNEIICNDINIVRSFYENLKRANDLGLKLLFDGDGFYVQATFDVNCVRDEEKHRNYRINNVREIEVFLDAWESSKLFNESLIYLKNS